MIFGINLVNIVGMILVKVESWKIQDAGGVGDLLKGISVTGLKKFAMIVKRMGNKSKLAHKIISYFPDHMYYFEPFFGAGGLFFNKPKCKYNYLNDLDSEVYNLFMVIKDNADEFKKQWEQIPIHQDLFRYWKINKETDPVKKAIRFVFLSNISLYAQGQTFRTRLGANNDSKILKGNLIKGVQFIQDVMFYNMDFRDFLNAFRESIATQKDRVFIYNDPPYLDVDNNYPEGFKEKDLVDLFDILEGLECKWAVSEFENNKVLDLAQQRGLQVITVGERRSINNRNVEILIINYNLKPKGLFY